MGLFDALKKLFSKQKQTKIIVVGLDNSGKTTILNRMKPDQERNLDIVPTVGSNVERFVVNNLKFEAWDMSGQGRYRNLWKSYYKECDAIIFVIDSADRIRMAVAKDELDLLLNDEDIQARRIPVLFYANKMDVRDAATSVEVCQLMQLQEIRDKPWHICATNALEQEPRGVVEGINWLSDQLKEMLDKR